MPALVENGHAGFIGAFRDALASGEAPAGVAAARFAVYRNNVAHSLTRALARRFPVCERLVGDAFFRALAGEFIRAHPPATPVLLLWGAEFPDFLRRFPPARALPYLPDVARIEYARGRAYHAADIQPLDGEALSARAGGDPGALRLSLAPSLQIVACDYPAVTIWRANQPGGKPAPRPQGAERALIWRSRDFQAPLRQIGPDEARFLRALIAGKPLAEAAAPLADPAPLLALLLGEGLIADASSAAGTA